MAVMVGAMSAQGLLMSPDVPPELRPYAVLVVALLMGGLTVRILVGPRFVARATEESLIDDRGERAPEIQVP